MKTYPKPTSEEVDRIEAIKRRLAKSAADTSPEQVARQVSIPITTLKNFLASPVLKENGEWRIQKRTRRALLNWEASAGTGRISRREKDQAMETLVRYINEGETREEQSDRYTDCLYELSRRGKSGTFKLEAL